ncbi:MAG: phospholipase [Gemmatimonadaceae bacterium]|nr:phospholipase [Gemmatimonadaceae bacterium]
MQRLIVEAWPYLLSLIHVLLASVVTVHAVLGRREVPAIIGWVGLAWLAPVMGSILYVVFGINRIRRSALQLGTPSVVVTGEMRVEPEVSLPAALLTHSSALDQLARVGGRVTGLPLRAGNRIEPLIDGDGAYPPMLEAIERAERSVMLASYIFDHDRVGVQFRDALAAAHRRGVMVRVLIDAVGARYGRPPMPRRLRELGVPVATFLPTAGRSLLRYANLRNHRKVLLVDGRVGFTGGMNIREGHQLSLAPADPVRCLHFRIEGPLVADMMRVFQQDWTFTTKEVLPPVEVLCPAIGRAGSVVARVVPDGPDADIENMPQLVLGAIAAARRRIAIVTPYFLPDARIASTLAVAALRGLQVDIILPQRNNVWLMDWATVPQLLPLLESGCRVWHTPPPFDHTKLFVIDGAWSLIGSTNWDARSLRLNFELNLECYDADLAAGLEALVSTRIDHARPVRLVDLQRRPAVVRVRDGLARLFSPYL